MESNGHGGNEFDGAFHYSGREGEGHVISNQHLGAHEYYTHHSGEEGKLIEHGDGFINKESSNEGGRELSGGISYQHVRTGDHSTINSDPNVQDIFKDHHATLEKYRTYTKQEGYEDHADIKGNNNYGYQGAEDHIQLSFGNLLNHQEPEIHEVTKVVPVHETIKIPEPHKVQKLFKIPVPVKVLEPFPIRIPVPYAVEKTVHVPVEKIIKYQVEKPVPVRVEKEVPVAVVKPYPVPFPVYKIKLIIHSGGPSYEE